MIRWALSEFGSMTRPWLVVVYSWGVEKSWSAMPLSQHWPSI